MVARITVVLRIAADKNEEAAATTDDDYDDADDAIEEDEDDHGHNSPGSKCCVFRMFQRESQG